MEAAVENGIDFGAWMSQSMSAAFSKQGFERKREEGNVRHDKKTNRNRS